MIAVEDRSQQAAQTGIHSHQKDSVTTQQGSLEDSLVKRRAWRPEILYRFRLGIRDSGWVAGFQRAQVLPQQLSAPKIACKNIITFPMEHHDCPWRSASPWRSRLGFAAGCSAGNLQDQAVHAVARMKGLSPLQSYRHGSEFLFSWAL